MPFIKLDCALLDSTLWVDRPARELFLTALLMGEPYELQEEVMEIETRTLENTDFVVPPGKYGFVRAAGIGIGRRAMLDDKDEVLSALERLASPEADSRSSEFDGRRMVRINGGFIILNWEKYRRKDHTAAERQRRFREKNPKPRKKSNALSRDVTALRNGEVTEGEGEGRGGGKGKRVVPETEGNKGKTSESSVGMDLIPTRESPITAKTVLETLKRMGEVEITQKHLLGWRIRVVFGYWIAKFNKDNARTKLTLGRWARLEKYLDLYDIETCLYAIDGAAIHPHANQEDGHTFHEFPEIFMNKPEGPDRVEKLSEYARTKDRHPKHRLLEKHPELEGHVE